MLRKFFYLDLARLGICYKLNHVTDVANMQLGSELRLLQEDNK